MQLLCCIDGIIIFRECHNISQVVMGVLFYNQIWKVHDCINYTTKKKYKKKKLHILWLDFDYCYCLEFCLSVNFHHNCYGFYSCIRLFINSIMTLARLVPLNKTLKCVQHINNSLFVQGKMHWIGDTYILYLSTKDLIHI